MVMDWDKGENGSDNLELDCDDGSRFRPSWEPDVVAVFGLAISADGEMLNGRAPCAA